MTAYTIAATRPSVSVASGASDTITFTTTALGLGWRATITNMATTRLYARGNLTAISAITDDGVVAIEPGATDTIPVALGAGVTIRNFTGAAQEYAVSAALIPPTRIRYDTILSETAIGAAAANLIGATLRARTGTRPTTLAGTPSGTVIANWTVAAITVASIDGTARLDMAATTVTAAASGTPTWAQLIRGDGSVAMDFDIGTAAQHAPLTITPGACIAGQPVSVGTVTITLPPAAL